MFSNTSEQNGYPNEIDENEARKTEKFTKGGVVVKVVKGVLPTGYNYFTVCYYQDGVRKRENLSDEGEARERAKAVLGTLVAGQVEAAAMKLQDVEAYEGAKRLLAPSGVTLETACREYAEVFALLKNRAPLMVAIREYIKRFEEVVAQKTVSEVVDEYLAAKEQ